MTGGEETEGRGPPCDDPARVAAFLAGLGLAGATCRPLTGDASTRRYQRLLRPGQASLILMQAPHPETELTPFVVIAERLRPLGLSVPEIIAADPALGLMVLEDFGDQTFARRLDQGDDPLPLYRLALDALATLHRGFSPSSSSPATRPLPVYQAAQFLEQVRLFTEWAPLHVTGQPLTPEARESFQEAWRAVLPVGLAGPVSLLLRDYHAGNLMLLPERTGVARVGLLDFQDAGIGPALYDGLSLIEDARRDLAPEHAAALTDYALAGWDRAVCEPAWSVLGAIRHTRVLAVFLRLAAWGKPGYLVHVPRVWRHLSAHLSHPALAPVATWFERHLPQLGRDP